MEWAALFDCPILKNELKWRKKIMPKSPSSKSISHPAQYDGLLTGIAKMLDIARHVSARAVNAFDERRLLDIG